jgi:hypothetical protein
MGYEFCYKIRVQNLKKIRENDPLPFVRTRRRFEQDPLQYIS